MPQSTTAYRDARRAAVRVRPPPPGQTLVLVALSLFALILVVALAVDVGNFYAQRRRMQNAADAGALAGAHELCFGDPTRAETMAYEYACTRNGAATAEIAVHDDVSVTGLGTTGGSRTHLGDVRAVSLIE